MWTGNLRGGGLCENRTNWGWREVVIVESKLLKACGQFCEIEDYISMQITSDVLISNVFIEKQAFALSKWCFMQHFCR